jgi:hypothetical protein
MIRAAHNTGFAPWLVPRTRPTTQATALSQGTLAARLRKCSQAHGQRINDRN